MLSKSGMDEAMGTVWRLGPRKSTVNRNCFMLGFGTARAGLAHRAFGFVYPAFTLTNLCMVEEINTR